MNMNRTSKDIKNRKIEVTLTDDTIEIKKFDDLAEAIAYVKELRTHYRENYAYGWAITLTIETFTDNDRQALHVKEYRFMLYRNYVEYIVLDDTMGDNIYYHRYHN